MERAAVALTYDIIATPVSVHKHDAEELRVNCIGIVKILDGQLPGSLGPTWADLRPPSGKLAQSDIVSQILLLGSKSSMADFGASRSSIRPHSISRTARRLLV